MTGAVTRPTPPGHGRCQGCKAKFPKDQYKACRAKATIGPTPSLGAASYSHSKDVARAISFRAACQRSSRRSQSTLAAPCHSYTRMHTVITLHAFILNVIGTRVPSLAKTGLVQLHGEDGPASQVDNVLRLFGKSRPAKTRKVKATVVSAATRPTPPGQGQC